MATNQIGTPQRRGLFPPDLFNDPDALAQIALAENPPTQTPSPDSANNVPFTGIVPKSFTEYAADPMNVAKIPEAVPANTPMPSVVAKAITSAMPQPADFPPPVDSSLAGSPESQQLFPDAQPAAGAGAKAPSFEDALISGPPNGGAGLTAAAKPAAPPTADTAPPIPLTKEQFLAQHPAKVPNAPYVPHGGKLALTGLFAAMDNAGAFLDHGTPTVGPGLMRNVQALQEYNQNLPVTQQQAEQGAYDEYLKNYTSARQNTLVPVTVQGPNGPMTTYVDPATQKSMLPAQIKAGGTVQAAQIGAQSRMDVKQLELQIQQGQISKMVPGINPANNQPQYEALNKAGKSLGFIDHSVVPGLIARTSSTVEYKEDGDGNLHALPKTTVSAPNLPGAGAGTRAPMTPPRPSVQPANAGGPGATPSASSGPSAHPAVTQPGTSVPSVPAGAPKPAAGIVPGFLGKAAKETGTAFDPKSNQYYITTRAEAGQNGYQNFTKSTATQIENDRQLNNRIADVQQKMDRYQGTFDKDLSDRDKLNLTALMGDNDFKVGMFGTEVPTGWLSKIVTTNAFQNMSPQAQQRFIAFANAREAMSGYQRVLTGSSRGNEKILQLQLDTLASPLWEPGQAKEAFSQFGENLRLAGQGLPKMPGVQSADDIKNRNAAGAQGGVPAGAKIRDYTQFK